MKRFLMLFLLLAASTCATGQENKTRVIFGELWLGGAGDGLGTGANINYQRGIHLFTARTSLLAGLPILDSLFLPPDREIDRQRTREFAILYGPRITGKGLSLSVSMGVSQNFHSASIVDEDDKYLGEESLRYVGIPFEVNLKFFKRRKIPYHIYGVFPVGGPTAFGRSFGLKVFADLRRGGYAGFAFTIGWGVHKKYTE
ncbi:hypothetical protein [Pedobacter deserti]|uniref:hypothetical protein n=1 Tax=Pedobacter deserti TaxID=2817382 RepID=UPI00210ACA02|nr:hypothetical protein [Pedobacter sp. SYSU D00382]